MRVQGQYIHDGVISFDRCLKHTLLNDATLTTNGGVLYSTE